jgi:hypothetical protein
VDSPSSLSGRKEFLELARPHGVVEVVRVSSETVHVYLGRELRPDELRRVRELAREWWSLSRVVLATCSDLTSSESERTE